MQSNKQPLHIIHFNDVYQIGENSKDPVGGVARFKTAIDSFKEVKPLLVFSGDAFSPSTLTPITQGEHMVFPLNNFGVDVACIGNHEFDIELEDL